ncbi:MAG: hypothetical protein JJT96_07725 [Opitutales bacterium]|nr:hypothetical protein [Opitutales bacterium]
MSDPIPFLAPRLVGERFKGHAVPLEVLKDLAALDEIIKVTAKWKFLLAHPDRKRVPRGFTEEISLRVIDIEPGSAIPKIMLFALGGQLFSPHQTYFEDARDSVLSAIEAAAHGGTITEHLPESILPHFDPLGRSLREDEAIEFRPSDAEHPARLDKTVRRKLLLASSQTQEYTDEVVLRGTIPAADQERRTFELQLINGQKIPGPMEAYHWETLLEAFNGFRDNVRVSISGIAQFSRANKLQRIETIEEINFLEANDVLARIDELRTLKDGWLDGKGRAPASEGLDWFAHEFSLRYPQALSLPYVYPTGEGGLQLEWSHAPYETSLEIDLATRAAEWHSVHLERGKEFSENLNLGEATGWETLAAKLKEQGAQQA